MTELLHQDLLVDNTVESVKQRLETTLGNIEFQKGQVFWDDIEKLQHCIKALENIKVLQDRVFKVADILEWKEY
tara:strand:+ start:2346 stop:2567 length:222 start_codon:yes stop_codon:yes gene_type:complete